MLYIGPLLLFLPQNQQKNRIDFLFLHAYNDFQTSVIDIILLT